MLSGDEESMIGDVDLENDLEIIQEGEDNQQVEEAEEENANQGDQSDDDESKKVVKPKRVVRNPQPKLNEETLKGPRGIKSLDKFFDRVKFKGRGHEEKDLNVLLKTYEYWCHRLYPKYPFDDCISKIEKLGAKKGVQTYIKRIRMDLFLDDDDEIKNNIDDDGENDMESNTNFETVENTQNSEFDRLLVTQNEVVPELSEEQLERIRINKELAEQRRLERLRKIRDRAESNLEVSSHLESNASSNKNNDKELININTESGLPEESLNKYDASESNSQKSAWLKTNVEPHKNSDEQLGFEELLDEVNSTSQEELAEESEIQENALESKSDHSKSNVKLNKSNNEELGFDELLNEINSNSAADLPGEVQMKLIKNQEITEN